MSRALKGLTSPCDQFWKFTCYYCGLHNLHSNPPLPPSRLLLSSTSSPHTQGTPSNRLPPAPRGYSPPTRKPSGVTCRNLRSKCVTSFSPKPSKSVPPIVSLTSSRSRFGYETVFFPRRTRQRIKATSTVEGERQPVLLNRQRESKAIASARLCKSSYSSYFLPRTKSVYTIYDLLVKEYET